MDNRFKKKDEINNLISKLDENDLFATMRQDCPYCGGRNTLTITRLPSSGKVVWNCYKAGCSARGSKKDMNPKILRQIIQSRISTELKTRNTKKEETIKNPMPEILSSLEHHPETIDFLKENNSYKAYEDHLLPIFYEPTQERIVFCNQKMTGGIGRTLNPYKKPKWLVYGSRADMPFVSIGETTTDSYTMVLVEDVLSACAVYKHCSEHTDPVTALVGTALLGTNLSMSCINALKKEEPNLNKFIICLDADASKKAIEIKIQLQAAIPRIPINIRLLSGPDIKHLSSSQVHKLLLP